MMAEELAKSMAPPTPWPTRIAMSQIAAGVPLVRSRRAGVKRR